MNVMSDDVTRDAVAAAVEAAELAHLSGAGWQTVAESAARAAVESVGRTLRVEIQSERDAPARCRVWIHGVPVFDGIARIAEATS